MRLLSHLNETEYPFFIPKSFLQSFSLEKYSLNFDPFSSLLEKESIPLNGLKSSVTYSLNEQLPKSFTVKAFHSNIIARASENSPEADAQFIVAPFSNLSSIFQGKQHLGLRTADCLAVAFSFENKEYFAGAISHAGWRGYSSGILQNTIEKLKNETKLVGISASELLTGLKVHIAPAIFGVSYECGQEVNEALLKHGNNLFAQYSNQSQFQDLYYKLINLNQDPELSLVINDLLIRNQQSIYIPGKIFPDLQLLAALECFLSGIPHENIEILRENTYSHPALFSFREASHKKSNASHRQWTHLSFPSIPRNLI